MDHLFETRDEFDTYAQQREADINVKIDDLRQADHADKIPQREDTIKNFLTEGILKFKHFETRNGSKRTSLRNLYT